MLYGSCYSYQRELGKEEGRSRQLSSVSRHDFDGLQCWIWSQTTPVNGGFSVQCQFLYSSLDDHICSLIACSDCFFSFILSETVGLLAAGCLCRPSTGPWPQVCREKAVLGPCAAAQAVLQALHKWWPPVWHICCRYEALQEPGDPDELHLQRLVSHVVITFL